MPGTIILLIVLLLFAFIKSVRIINENQRGVTFRLGRFQRIDGPGLIIIVPFVDRLLKVDLQSKIPQWQTLTKEQLEDRVKVISMSELK